MHLSKEGIVLELSTKSSLGGDRDFAVTLAMAESGWPVVIAVQSPEYLGGLVIPCGPAKIGNLAEQLQGHRGWAFNHCHNLLHCTPWAYLTEVCWITTRLFITNLNTSKSLHAGNMSEWHRSNIRSIFHFPWKTQLCESRSYFPTLNNDINQSNTSHSYLFYKSNLANIMVNVKGLSLGLSHSW